MKRLIALLLIALSAVAVSAAGAKDPTPPVGTWDLKTIRATYSGPPAPLRLALTKLIQGRVVFSPVCTQSVCATYATVRNARGTRVKFVMIDKSGVFTGRAVMATGLRCGGRALRATLTMTAKLIQRQAEPVDVLTGMAEARAQNPGGCSLFRGQTRGVRKHWFYGVSANG